MEFIQTTFDKNAHFIPQKLIECFGGIGNILQLPNYQIDNDKIDAITEYIDFIEANTVEHPIMKTVDKYGRLCIILKGTWELKKWKDGNLFDSPWKLGHAENMTHMLFQRYNDLNKWCVTSLPDQFNFLLSSGIDYEKLKKVLKNEIIKNIECSYSIVDYQLLQ
jgi:hypothetical protein